MRKRSWNTAGPQRGHFSAPLKKPCCACVTVSVCSNGCSCSTFITIIMRRRVLIASIKAFGCLDVCPSADGLVLCKVPTSYTRATFKSWPCEINKVYVSFSKHIFPSPRHKDHMKPPYFGDVGLLTLDSGRTGPLSHAALPSLMHIFPHQSFM